MLIKIVIIVLIDKLC